MDEVKFVKKYFSDLFSWKELENLINIRPLMKSSMVRIISDENDKEYTWENDAWTSDPNCWPPSMLKKFLDTHHCCFTEMSRCTKNINFFAKKLEEKYNLPTDAHIYICRNPKLQHPFGIHFDFSDNVIVQCEGETNFKVWNKIKDINEKSTKMNINNVPILDVNMKPGDAIWIPRYYPHLAASKTSRLSISFPMTYSTNKTFQEREWIHL